MLKKYNSQIISFRFKKSNNITHFTEFLLNIVKTSSLLRGTRHLIIIIIITITIILIIITGTRHTSR